MLSRTRTEGRANYRREVPGATPDPATLGRAFRVLLLLWVCFPLLRWGTFAQDALPTVVAGDLVVGDPGSVYSASGDLYELEPRFASRSCGLAPAGTRCDEVLVGFVATPLVLPAARLLALVGPEAGSALLRVVGAASLAGGMLLLWRRLADRSDAAPGHLLLTAVLLTPFVTVPVGLGQTSPLLFLLAVAGVGATDVSSRRRWATAGLWAATIALKLFPAALVVVAGAQRRWRLVGASAAWVAALVALTLLTVPPEVLGDFVDATRALGTSGVNDRNPYSGSLDAVLSRIVAPDGGTTPAGLLWGLRLAVVAALVWATSRLRDPDTQWAFASLGLLLVVPLVWSHYLWVAVAAVGVAASAPTARPGGTRALAATAGLLLPVGIVAGRGGGAALGQYAVLLAAAGLTWWVAQPSTVASDGR